MAIPRVYVGTVSGRIATLFRVGWGKQLGVHLPTQNSNELTNIMLIRNTNKFEFTDGHYFGGRGRGGFLTSTPSPLGLRPWGQLIGSLLFYCCDQYVI